MSPKPKAIVKKKRDINTYSELWHASDCVLEKGINDPVACSWQFLASIMLTAFTFEAYLNHVGTKLFKCWDDLERKLTIEAKFQLISEKLDVSFDKTQRPLKTMTDLFKFRNQIAHGKSDLVSEEFETSLKALDKKLYSRLNTNWEEKIQNNKFAKLVRIDVAKLLKTIHEKIPEPKEHLFSFGLQQRGAEIIKG